MEKELKQKVTKLLSPSNLTHHVEVTVYLSQIMESLMKVHHSIGFKSDFEFDNSILLQKILSSAKHFIHLNNGLQLVDYSNKEFIDPTVQIILSRNVFETIVLFNMMNILHNNHSDQEFIHKLWRLSSLNFRKRIHDFAKSKGAKTIVQDELKEATDLEKEILDSDQYVKGSDKSKIQVEKAIKGKKFWTLIMDGKVNTTVGPQDLCDIMVNNQNIMKKQYSRYSMYAHPSKESVNMFSRIFKNDDYKKLISANLRLTNCLFSMMICDYVLSYSDLISSYEKLPKEHQIICSFYNKMIRNDYTSINNAYRVLVS